MGEISVPIVVVGVNHSSADVEIRERLSVSPDFVENELSELYSSANMEGCMLLCTCNRVEYYMHGSCPEYLVSALGEYIKKKRGVDLDGLGDAVYVKKGEEAVKHLFRVASGADSLVLGEPQILGQVKQAYFHCVQAGVNSRIIDKLLHKTFSTAKRVRTSTALGRSKVSIGHLAVDMAAQVFDGLSDKRCLLLGAGEMAEIVARYFVERGIGEILVANRTFERASEIASIYGGAAVHWSKFKEYLPEVDMILTSTASDKPVITKLDVESALRRRKQKPMLFIDIAVPRNCEPSIKSIDNVFLYDLDDFRTVVEKHKSEREAALAEAEALINIEVSSFLLTLERMKADPMVRVITERAEQIRRAELERTLKYLENLDEDAVAAIDRMTKSIVKKLLHNPIEFIKSEKLAEDEKTSERKVVERLFKIERGGRK